MFKNWFFVICAVLAVSGLPYYAQDISEFLPHNAGLESATQSPIAASAQRQTPAQPVAHADLVRDPG